MKRKNSNSEANAKELATQMFRDQLEEWLQIADVEEIKDMLRLYQELVTTMFFKTWPLRRVLDLVTILETSLDHDRRKKSEEEQ
jgi:hypothetical protein